MKARLMPPFSTGILRPKEVVEQKPTAYFVGAAGAGMKALAEVLLDDGWNLSGSDSAADPRIVEILSHRGMPVASGHAKETLSSDVELVISSAAVPETNSILQQAAQNGVAHMRYVEALGCLTQQQRTVGVAGTHGKSSTTSNLVTLLERGGASPTFLCGAERCLDQRNGKLGTDNLLIVEACEYRRHFLALCPDVICLLGVEPDHFDCYPNFEDCVAAYRDFVSLLPDNGTLILNRDCPTACDIVTSAPSRIVDYSLSNPEAEWFATKEGEDVVFFRNSNSLTKIAAPEIAPHQLQNVLAAIATASAIGHTTTEVDIQRAVTEPVQLKRRFEIIEQNETYTLVDDYAHHPTEIAATLEMARIRYPKSRILCCFQPHQLSRTQSLRERFVDALALADRVYVLPVFGAREAASGEFVLESERIVMELQEREKEALLISSLDRVWRKLETDAQNHDVILTLGAGDLSRIHNERTR